MGNSLLSVRGINHKYIVVEKEVKILVKDPDVELDIAEDEEIAMTEADDDVVTIEE